MFKSTIRAAAICMALSVAFSTMLVGLQSVGGAGSAQAQSGQIRSINVDGNKRVERETVLSYLTLMPGDAYTAQGADESFKALFGTGLFSDVRIGFSAGVVNVVVVENPVVNRVAFEGNRDLKDDVLAAEGQLRARSVYTRAAAQADVQRILGIYRASGYYSATVEAKIIKLPFNRVDLVFEINEGESTKVLSINFIGNSAFSDSQLRGVISTSESSLLSFLKPTDVYDPDRINLDRELLRRYYLSNGYADARVVSAVADLDIDGKGFFITFTVDEGPLYTVGSVRIESMLPGVDPDAFTSSLLLNQGDVFNALLVDRTAEVLTVAISREGFPFAQVEPQIDRDPISRQINIIMVIRQGPRVYVERINIIGNTRTLDYVVRREIRVVEGDAYNRLMIDQARIRLQNLGYFKSVEVTQERGSAPDRLIVTFNVVEQATGELGLAGGYSSLEGIIGEISYTERNLLGRGQFLRLKLSGSLERGQIDLSFTEPRFLDRQLSAGFDLFHKELDYKSRAGYRKRETGGSVRLGFALADNLYMTTRYTYSHDEVFDLATNVSEAVKELEGITDTSSVGYSLVYDTRNHRMAPTRGWYLSLVQDFAGVGGDVNYLRSIVEARGYYPIVDGVTFVARAIAGNIEALDGGDVRISDAFYQGSAIVRGFETTGLGPRDQFGDALGGKTFYAATAEVRFPFPFIPDEIGLSGAVFADAGSVFGTDVTKDCTGAPAQGTACFEDSDALRASVGASILWNSPVGPLRADFAYVLLSEEFDKEQAFSFGASTRF
jgi:outer membrane protein insertion porin family